MFSRSLGVFLLVVGFSVVGCKEVKPEPAPPNAVAEEALRRIQEPQQRVRDVEQEMLERNRQQLESVDQM